MGNTPESGPGSPRDQAQPKSADSRDSESLFAGVGELCDIARLRTGADGAALAVLTRTARVRELLYATDTIAQKLDELQYTLGEGPCFDAYLDDSPQFHPELRSGAQTSRWPTFAADATQRGVHSLFAFPVPDGRRPMGVLELYRRTAGSLARAEYVAAAACATSIARRLQSNWEGHVSRFDSAEQAIDAAAGAALSEPADPFTRTQVHVAGGMVAIQLGVSPNDGVGRIRAYAYAGGRPISAVAADIIGRRLTLLDQPEPPSG
jgi:hypothetical protein